MKITNIQLTEETKNKIASFGSKGESYDEILRRIYNLAVKTQLREFLMPSNSSVSIEEAIRQLKEKYLSY